MPAEKTGKYIECQMKNCDNVKYWPPAKLKNRNKFFCSNKCSGAYRTMTRNISCECAHCKNVFKKPLAHILCSYAEGGKFFYCDRQCYGESLKNSIDTFCRKCGSQITKPIGEYEKCEFYFCSSKCSKSWRKYPKTKKLRDAISARKAAQQLRPYYLVNALGLRKKDVIDAPEIVLLKKLSILRKRQLKQIQHAE
jgi:hypothetical protein